MVAAPPAPLFVRVSELVTLGILLAVLLSPGLFAAVLWSPFLLSARLRALFRALPPGDGLVGSYLLVSLVGVLPYVAGWAWGLSQPTGPPGARAANALLDALVGLGLGYIVCGPLAAGLALPRLGRDWDPTGYGPGTWALLVAGSAWFAVLYGVPLFVVAAILSYPA